MWEVVTAGRPFKGMPLISLGHNIAVQGMRPQWPIAVPLRYRMLAERCWAHAPEERPTMDAVVAQLTEMRAEAGGSTPCVDMSYHQVCCVRGSCFRGVAGCCMHVVVLSCSDVRRTCHLCKAEHLIYPSKSEVFIWLLAQQRQLA